MQTALKLALKARGQTTPNPMVGTVIVKGSKIIAQGWHHQCGADHAEIDAFKKAKKDVKGATLYVTLEPCHHVGRTPPCVDEIIKRGIKEVIIAMKDPNPLTNGKSISKLKRAGIKVQVGVLEKEAQKINEAFVKYIRTGMPFVVAKSAQTLDGKIATATGDSKWITSDKTRAFARAKRDEFDAILVGGNTVLKDNPSLNAHKKTIKKVVVDSKLAISPKAKLFSGVNLSDCILATTKQASQTKIRAFEKKGITVLVCPQNKAGVDLKWLFKELAKRSIISILIEGGATIIGDALKNNLVDKMHIYVAPKIVGDQKALSAIVGLNTRYINQALQFTDVNLAKIDQDFFITAYVHRNR